MKKTEQHIRNLIEKPIDLDELEIEINKLKPIKNNDSELMSKLHQKYSDGREFQSNCVTIIQSAQENEFTEEGIKVIEQLMKDAKKLNLDFSELRRLETVKFIPRWVNRLHTIVVENFNSKGSQKDAISQSQQNSQAGSGSKKDTKLKKMKPLRTLRTEVVKGLDLMDPQKISSSIKQDLIDALCKNIPEVLDQELFKLLNKVKLILWNKDAFDLLGQESISLKDLILLKETPAQDDNSFKYLKFKYLTYHKQITELINQQETWMNKAQQFQQKYPVDEEISDKSKIEQFKKGLDNLKKGLNPNIEKITEVKERFSSIQQQLQQIEWIIDCKEYLKSGSEKKKLEDIEVFHRRAENCNVSKSCQTFQEIEQIFTQVKDLTIKSKKLMDIITNSQNTQESKMEIEQDKDKIEINDYELKANAFKNKMTQDELDQTLQKMKDINNRVNFETQIEFLENSKKNLEKYITLIKRCVNAHWNNIENYSQTPIEELREIRNQINQISKIEQCILVALPKFDDQYLKLLWGIECALFLSTSNAIKMNKDIEECKKLVRASKVIKDIESNKLCKNLNEQLNLYSKCSDAVDILKKDEKKKKPNERESLTNMQKFNELENVLKTVIIDDSKQQFKYVQKLKRKIQLLIEEYEEEIKKENRQPLKVWKELLEKFQTSKIPIKCDEEYMLEQLVQNAEEMETTLKANKKSQGSANKKSSVNTKNQQNSEITQLLERYRIQQVKIPEAEKLLEKWKMKEDALSVIEKKLYGTLEIFSIQEIIEVYKEVQALKSEFKGERIEKIEQELLLKKIFALKQSLNGDIISQESTYEQMKNFLNQAKENFKNRTEPRYLAGIQFLQEVVDQCEERIKEIENISSVKELETILKSNKKDKKSLKFSGFVDLTYEVTERLDRLRLEIEQQHKKELEKKQKLKQQAKERKEKLEEERKQKILNDPRNIKRREAEEKLKEKLSKEKKVANQLKQQLISDVSRAINIAYQNLTLQDCLLFGTKLIERLLIENSNSNQLSQQQANSYCKLFAELNKYPNIHAQIKKLKFDYSEIERLVKIQSESKRIGRNKDALEKEEQIIEISNNINKKENDYMLDIKFKKKDVLDSGLEGGPQKKLKTDALSINMLFNNQLDALNKSKNEDQSFVNIDENNMVKQSIAKIREGKLSTMKKSTTKEETLASKKFGAKFSDDEEDDVEADQDYIPLREEDFQSLNESLIIQQHKQMKEQETKYVQFNPDEESLSQNLDEADEFIPVYSLLKGSFQIQMANNEQPFGIERIYVLTCDDSKEFSQIPKCPIRNQSMHIKGVLNLNKFRDYHSSLIQERALNPERRIIIVSGWFESDFPEDHLLLEQYANQLKNQRHVAVVEWTPECKLYILHRDQWNNRGNEGHQIKFKRDFFHQSENPNNALLYMIIFKEYKLPNRQDRYETVRPYYMKKRTQNHNIVQQPVQNPIYQNHEENNNMSENDKKLHQIINIYSNTPNGNEKFTNSIKQNLISDIDNSFSRGKKSLNKITALEVLTLKGQDEDILGTEEEQHRLNQKLLGMRNQINHNEKFSVNKFSQNPYSSVKKFETSYSQQQTQHYNPRYTNHLSQPQLSYQQQIHQQQQNALSRHQSNERSYQRSANRSGVSTPNYYEQKFAAEQESYSRNSSAYHNKHQYYQQSNTKSPYQRSLNFNNNPNESIEIEDNYNHQYKSNFQQEQQQIPYNTSESLYKRTPFKGPVRGFKKTYHTTKQIPQRNLQKSGYDNSQSQRYEQPSQFQNILNRLDQTMKELVKNSEAKNQNRVLNTLIQQQKQQQQLMNLHLSMQNTNTNINSQGSDPNLQNVGEKKKSRKRGKKRAFDSAGLNNSVSVEGDSYSEEMNSRDSFSVSRSVQNSQQQPNIQVHQNFKHPGENNNYLNASLSIKQIFVLSYENQKKQMKIYEKQSQKLANQHQRTTNTTSTQQFAKQNTQQPNFTKNNNQILSQDKTIIPPSIAVVANQQKDLQPQNHLYQVPQTLSNSNSIAKIHNNKPYSRPMQGINNDIAGVLYTNQSNSNNNYSNSNQGVKSTIKIADPIVSQSIQSQESVHHKQQHQSNQHPNSLTALNSTHNQMKTSLKTNQANSNQSVNNSNPQRTQILHQDNQFSQDSIKIFNSSKSFQESKNIMGLKDITSSIISPNNTTKISNGLPPNHTFRNLSKEQGMDKETQASIRQHPVNNNLLINHSQGRHLLSDLSKSGRINQGNTNRGVIKESVRNPIFYPTMQEENQLNKDQPLLLKKNNFQQRSSVSSRDGSLEKSHERPYISEKENIL